MTANAVEFETAGVNEQGIIAERSKRAVQSFAEDLGGGVALEMVAIPAGTFTRGSPANEAERLEYEGPQRSVSVAPFWMGRFEVTQAQWRAVAKLPRVSRDLAAAPLHFKGDARLPVEQVSWHDAVEFCARLTLRSGREYRLPSEAEWEHAARAGTTTPFHFGATITPELVNYNGDHP